MKRICVGLGEGGSRLLKCIFERRGERKILEQFLKIFFLQTNYDDFGTLESPNPL